MNRSCRGAHVSGPAPPKLLCTSSAFDKSKLLPWPMHGCSGGGGGDGLGGGPGGDGGDGGGSGGDGGEGGSNGNGGGADGGEQKKMSVLTHLLPEGGSMHSRVFPDNSVL